jgi:hypothetical protein
MAEEALIREFMALHQRLDALRMAQSQVLQFEAGYAGRNPAVLDRYEDFYTGRDDLHEDRQEFGADIALAELHAQLNALQQAREQEQHRGHEQGMGL